MTIEPATGAQRAFSFLAETTAGTAATTGAATTLRSKSGVKFDLKRNTFTSNERRADRQKSALVYGAKSGSFSIPVEWSDDSFDALLEACLGGTWGGTNVLKIGNTVRTFTFNDILTELTLVEQNLGCQVTGFTVEQKKDAVAEGTIEGIFRDVHGPQTTGVTLAYDSTAKTITRTVGSFLTDGWVNGDSVRGIGNTDAGNNNTTPWVLTTLSATVMTFTTAAGIVTKAATAGITLNNAAPAACTLTDAATTTPFNEFSGSITEGGNVIAHVAGWNLKFSQASTLHNALGSTVAQGSAMGGIDVTGSLNVYCINQTLRSKFLNGTSTTLSLVLSDGANTRTFDLGTVKYTSNNRDDGEMAIMENMDFTATYTATDTALKITRSA